MVSVFYLQNLILKTIISNSFTDKYYPINTATATACQHSKQRYHHNAEKKSVSKYFHFVLSTRLFNLRFSSAKIRFPLLATRLSALTMIPAQFFSHTILFVSLTFSML